MLDRLPIWSQLSTNWIVLISLVSMLLLALTIVATPWLLARLPADYFSSNLQRRNRGTLAILWSTIRTGAGLVLLVIGIVMFITPGPGLVCVVMGVALSDFPGKHTLLNKLVSHPKVFRALNWMRSKRGRAPFTYPEQR